VRLEHLLLRENSGELLTNFNTKVIISIIILALTLLSLPRHCYQIY
jgi:hypothetical protein